MFTRRFSLFSRLHIPLFTAVTWILGLGGRAKHIDIGRQLTDDKCRVVSPLQEIIFLTQLFVRENSNIFRASFAVLIISHKIAFYRILGKLRTRPKPFIFCVFWSFSPTVTPPSMFQTRPCSPRPFWRQPKVRVSVFFVPSP